MKCNEAYMIPAYEEREDTSVLKMQASSFRTPYRKHWQATVQGLQKNAVLAQTLTADARVALKVNAAITRIESCFVSAGKFLRAELLQMKQSGIAGTSDVIQVTAERYIDLHLQQCR